VTTRRFLPTDPADFVRSIVPVALLAVAALVPAARIVVAIVLVVVTGVAINRAAPVRWAWAASVPIAAGLAWHAWSGPFEPSDLACMDPTSPFAVERLLEAAIVLGVLVTLAVILGASRSSLGLQLPARRYISWAILGFVIAGPIALAVGPILARPFFGDVSYDVTRAGAVVPALVFAASNGILEEIAYRGALLNWTARVIGVGPALLAQAVIFGLAHSGTGEGTSQAVLIVGMTLAGLIAGAVALRTRSLLVPMAIHIGLDIPIYYAWACSSTT
jgi:membrane protease YdiL (CAAX protease family)